MKRKRPDPEQDESDFWRNWGRDGFLEMGYYLLAAVVVTLFLSWLWVMYGG